MRRHATRTVLLASALVTMLGCVSTAGFKLLTLVGLSKDPVVILLVAAPPTEAGTPGELLNPFEPFGKLNPALTQAVGRPVVNDLCFPFQLEPNLTLGLAQLAYLSPADYARLPNPDKFRVIAVSADAQKRSARGGLLIVKRESPVQAVADLRGKSLVFGPPSDARTHQAALLMLQQNGIQRGDLSLEPLPLPGTLKTRPKSKDVIDTVLAGGGDGGFIDEAAWEELPDTSASGPARNRLRVIGRTAALPDRLFIASPTLDAPTADGLIRFLIEAAEKHPETLTPMKVAMFVAESPEVTAACRALKAMPLGDSATPPGMPAEAAETQPQ